MWREACKLGPAPKPPLCSESNWWTLELIWHIWSLPIPDLKWCPSWNLAVVKNITLWKIHACFCNVTKLSCGLFLPPFSGVDMTAILSKLGFDDALVQSKLAAGTSTFVLAYAIHKLFAPVRISITLVSVPLLVRYFRKIGFFKPPTPNPWLNHWRKTRLPPQLI